MEPGASDPTPPDVTVVVVTWQQRELVLACLASVARQTHPCRVLVVDNASDDGTAEALAQQYPEAQVLRLPDNAGFAGGVAAALGVVQTRFVALLNNDAVANPEWLAASLARFDDPSVAAVTAKLLLLRDPDADRDADRDDPEPRVNNAGVVLLRTGYGADRGLGDLDDAVLARPAEVFGFSGGAAVLRTLAVRAVGGMPASFFMYYEDTDLSWRLRLAGWRIVYEPAAVVWHRHAASSDVRSETFAFHNERNRLLTLVRNAPLGVVARSTGRFALTTASLVAKRATGRPLPSDPVFRPRLRLRVLSAAAAGLPAAIRARYAAPRRRGRAAVWSDWAGVPARGDGADFPGQEG